MHKSFQDSGNSIVLQLRSVAGMGRMADNYYVVVSEEFECFVIDRCAVSIRTDANISVLLSKHFSIINERYYPFLKYERFHTPWITETHNGILRQLFSRCLDTSIVMFLPTSLTFHTGWL